MLGKGIHARRQRIHAADERIKAFSDGVHADRQFGELLIGAHLPFGNPAHQRRQFQQLVRQDAATKLCLPFRVLIKQPQ